MVIHQRGDTEAIDGTTYREKERERGKWKGRSLKKRRMKERGDKRYRGCTTVQSCLDTGHQIITKNERKERRMSESNHLARAEAASKREEDETH